MNESKISDFKRQQPKKYEWCKRPFLKGGAIGLLLGNALGFIVSVYSVADEYESPIKIEVILGFSAFGFVIGLIVGKYISDKRFSGAIDKVLSNPENKS